MWLCHACAQSPPPGLTIQTDCELCENRKACGWFKEITPTRPAKYSREDILKKFTDKEPDDPPT